MNKLQYFVAGIVFGLMSCQNVPIDSALAAIAGNDPSVAFSGCNQPMRKGYLFCQVREKANPSEMIKLYLPGVECSAESCIVYQFLRSDGSYGLGGSLKRGQTLLEVSVADVVGSSEALSLDKDGEYQVLLKVQYVDNNKTEHVMAMKGFIRVNVLKADFVPLVCGESKVAWVAGEKSCQVQYSAKLRSVLCGRSCD